jgi:hypothetical protein
MLTVFDKRPPYVKFEEREMGLDPEATKKEGRPIPRTVVLALITAHGAKDTHETIATDWLERLRVQGANGDEYAANCYDRFSKQYEAWLKGHELPRDGTPVKTWAMCTREAATRLIAIGITTVEDLAAVTDNTLSTIGMDGRYLRDMARGWITEAKDKGANAKALADANVEITLLRQRIEAQDKRIDKLLQRLEAADDDEPKPRRGRPPKAESAEALI